MLISLAYGVELLKMGFYKLLLYASFFIAAFSIYFNYHNEPPKIDDKFRKPKYWGYLNLKGNTV
jgi:hypothetical protein